MNRRFDSVEAAADSLRIYAGDSRTNRFAEIEFRAPHDLVTAAANLHGWQKSRASAVAEALALSDPRSTAMSLLGAAAEDVIPPSHAAHLTVQPSPYASGAHVKVWTLQGSRICDVSLAAFDDRIVSLEIELDGREGQTQGSRWLARMLQAQRLPQLRTLAIRGAGEVTPDLVSQLSQCRRLERLEIQPKTSETAEALLTKLAGMTNLRSLAISEVDGKAAWGKLAALTQLEELSLLGGKLGRAGAAALPKLSKLLALSLTIWGLNDSEVRALAKLPELQCLKLRNNPIKAFEPIWSLEGLIELDLYATSLHPAAATGLAKLRKLEYLDVGSNPVSDESVPVLAGLSALRVLGMDGTSLRSPKLGLLAQCRELRSLALGNTSVKQGFGELKSLQELEVLDLRRALKWPELGDDLARLTQLRQLNLSWMDLKHQDLERLDNLKQLRELTLFNNPQLGESADAVSKHTRLTRLDIGNVGLTECGFAKLAALKELHWLRAVENEPGARGVSAIARLPRLHWADLGRCGVEGAWLAPLEAKSLKALWLYNNPLGERAVESLITLGDLHELDVRGCGISKDGVQRICSKLTNTRVVFE
jgi:Leucine-rich repeat (LRR) protein